MVLLPVVLTTEAEDVDYVLHPNHLIIVNANGSNEQTQVTVIPYLKPRKRKESNSGKLQRGSNSATIGRPPPDGTLLCSLQLLIHLVILKSSEQST